MYTIFSFLENTKQMQINMGQHKHKYNFMISWISRETKQNKNIKKNFKRRASPNEFFMIFLF